MTKVLVVDDDPVARSLVVLALDEAGIEVHEAADGAEALSRMEATTFDAVVLDLVMPVMSGQDMLRCVDERQLAPAAAVVVLSCKADDEDVAEALALGADAYLTKPFDPDTVVRSVRDLVYGKLVVD